ncbi:Peroxisomal biogenesis factor 6 [Zancudomyces culisetae]|uniref:Peroxisomal biogenesis factor 6 n=1 Tax=Zancudomyces culisetae TaxID=1213189 RepID=A0A1R1PUK2_ZANCU|nr:Peroxisomal biogenesis factor 6 [Zancudomyces culisetae]|eukprot:OMH84644.1 Peroxisomal biogenesis factor 6 [Zancudomyces culisetae]
MREYWERRGRGRATKVKVVISADEGDDQTGIGITENLSCDFAAPTELFRVAGIENPDVIFVKINIKRLIDKDNETRVVKLLPEAKIKDSREFFNKKKWSANKSDCGQSQDALEIYGINPNMYEWLKSDIEWKMENGSSREISGQEYVDFEATIEIVEPVVLDQVVLSARKREFHDLQTQKDVIGAWIANGLSSFRLHQTYAVKYKEKWIKMNCESCQPEEEGRFVFGHTKIVLIERTEEKTEKNPTLQGESVDATGYQVKLYPIDITSGTERAQSIIEQLYVDISGTEDTAGTVGFMRIKAMARCGIISGEWVTLVNPKTHRKRVIKIVGYDGVDNENGLYVSGNLICSMMVNGDEIDTTVQCVLEKRQEKTLEFPIAKNLVLKRVITPESIKPEIEKYANAEIKSFFGGKASRVMYKGDILRFEIRENEARIKNKLYSQITNEMSDVGEIEEVWNEAEIAYKGDGEGQSGGKNIYYQVSDLEYRNLSDQEFCEDNQIGLTIDKESTRIVISGSINMRIPFISGNDGEDVYREEGERIYKLLDSAIKLGRKRRNIGITLGIKGNIGSGKRQILRRQSEKLGYNFYEVKGSEIVAEINKSSSKNATKGLVGVIEAFMEHCSEIAPVVLYLSELEVIAEHFEVTYGDESRNRELDIFIRKVKNVIKEQMERTIDERGYPMVVVTGLSLNNTKELKDTETKVFYGMNIQEVTINAPNIEQRRRIFLEEIEKRTGHTIGKTGLVNMELAKEMSKQTASFYAKDIVRAVEFGTIDAVKRSRTATKIDKQDLERGIEKVRGNISNMLGVPKIPNVKWEDVGGLEHAKQEIIDTIQLPLLQINGGGDGGGGGMKVRSGLLFYGPPGTGKTLLAKAIATESKLNFFSVKGPELINMYVGESERQIRQVFNKAREASPCVVFFDELDSLAPKRGQLGDSGGVMDRIVSQLLAELDGTHESQFKILTALTRKLVLESNKEDTLEQVSNLCPLNLTGADLYALCADAQLKATIRTIQNIDKKVEEYTISTQLSETRDEHGGGNDGGGGNGSKLQYYLDNIADKNDLKVVLTKQDFLDALSELEPSVSFNDLEKYQALRSKFQ